jgi:ABC-type multidrug transport system fused ATPase/permease subunit
VGRQRIGIARAILKRSSIYILDEPTSFLDLKTEELILNYFRSQEKLTTQIIIAHRLHMVMDADWIIMLEKGEIIAQGSPQHLKRTCCSFRELWELDKHESSSQTL